MTRRPKPVHPTNRPPEHRNQPAWEVTNMMLADVLNWIREDGHPIDRAQLVYGPCGLHELHLIFTEETP
jgi:hypothetical protein